MATQTLTCPYCNAAIDTETSRTAGQRIVCPRCGDAFTLRPSDAFTNQPPPPPVETGITATPPIAPPARWSNRMIAAVVLGVMFVMAGVGLAFMLATQKERRAHDTSRPPRRPGRQPGLIEPEQPAVAAVAPDRLAALGYLPSGINFLFAARVPELLAGPVGTQLLRDPIKLGGSQYRVEELPAWVGLRLEDIDHLVFAARVDDALIPPFYLVIRTVESYDEEAVRQRLKAARVGGAGPKKLYSFRSPKKDVPLHVWFADARTLVIALFADQLEMLPNRPADDLRRLPDELSNVLTTRREPVAPAWIAGHSRNWMQTPAVRFLNRLKKEEVEKLAPLRTFGVWLVPDKALDVKAVFACQDDKGARGLEEYFRTLSRDDPAFKTALDGPWLTLQFQAGPDFLSRLMKR
jgi:hypothetical protein